VPILSTDGTAIRADRSRIAKRMGRARLAWQGCRGEAWRSGLGSCAQRVPRQGGAQQLGAAHRALRVERVGIGGPPNWSPRVVCRAESLPPFAELAWLGPSLRHRFRGAPGVMAPRAAIP